MWNNYGMTFIEYIFLNYFRKNDSHISIKNDQILHDIVKEKKTRNFCFRAFCEF